MPDRGPKENNGESGRVSPSPFQDMPLIPSPQRAAKAARHIFNVLQLTGRKDKADSSEGRGEGGVSSRAALSDTNSTPAETPMSPPPRRAAPAPPPGPSGGVKDTAAPTTLPTLSRRNSIGSCSECASKSHLLLDDGTGTNRLVCPKCKTNSGQTAGNTGMPIRQKQGGVPAEEGGHAIPTPAGSSAPPPPPPSRPSPALPLPPQKAPPPPASLDEEPAKDGNRGDEGVEVDATLHSTKDDSAISHASDTKDAHIQDELPPSARREQLQQQSYYLSPTTPAPPERSPRSDMYEPPLEVTPSPAPAGRNSAQNGAEGGDNAEDETARAATTGALSLRIVSPARASIHNDTSDGAAERRGSAVFISSRYNVPEDIMASLIMDLEQEYALALEHNVTENNTRLAALEAALASRSAKVFKKLGEDMRALRDISRKDKEHIKVLSDRLEQQETMLEELQSINWLENERSKLQNLISELVGGPRRAVDGDTEDMSALRSENERLLADMREIQSTAHVKVYELERIIVDLQARLEKAGQDPDGSRQRNDARVRELVEMTTEDIRGHAAVLSAKNSEEKTIDSPPKEEILEYRRKISYLERENFHLNEKMANRKDSFLSSDGVNPVEDAKRPIRCEVQDASTQAEHEWDDLASSRNSGNYGIDSDGLRADVAEQERDAMKVECEKLRSALLQVQRDMKSQLEKSKDNYRSALGGMTAEMELLKSENLHLHSRLDDVSEPSQKSMEKADIRDNVLKNNSPGYDMPVAEATNKESVGYGNTNNTREPPKDDLGEVAADRLDVRAGDREIADMSQPNVSLVASRDDVQSSQNASQSGVVEFPSAPKHAGGTDGEMSLKEKENQHQHLDEEFRKVSEDNRYLRNQYSEMAMKLEALMERDAEREKDIAKRIDEAIQVRQAKASSIHNVESGQALLSPDKASQNSADDSVKRQMVADISRLKSELQKTSRLEEEIHRLANENDDLKAQNSELQSSLVENQSVFSSRLNELRDEMLSHQNRLASHAEDDRRQIREEILAATQRSGAGRDEPKSPGKDVTNLPSRLSEAAGDSVMKSSSPSEAANDLHRHVAGKNQQKHESKETSHGDNANVLYDGDMMGTGKVNGSNISANDNERSHMAIGESGSGVLVGQGRKPSRSAPLPPDLQQGSKTTASAKPDRREHQTQWRSTSPPENLAPPLSKEPSFEQADSSGSALGQTLSSMNSSLVTRTIGVVEEENQALANLIHEVRSFSGSPAPQVGMMTKVTPFKSPNDSMDFTSPTVLVYPGSPLVVEKRPSSPLLSPHRSVVEDALVNRAARKSLSPQRNTRLSPPISASSSHAASTRQRISSSRSPPSSPLLRRASPPTQGRIPSRPAPSTPLSLSLGMLSGGAPYQPKSTSLDSSVQNDTSSGTILSETHRQRDILASKLAELESRIDSSVERAARHSYESGSDIHASDSISAVAEATRGEGYAESNAAFVKSAEADMKALEKMRKEREKDERQRVLGKTLDRDTGIGYTPAHRPATDAPMSGSAQKGDEGDNEKDDIVISDKAETQKIHHSHDASEGTVEENPERTAAASQANFRRDSVQVGPVAGVNFDASKPAHILPPEIPPPPASLGISEADLRLERFKESQRKFEKEQEARLARLEQLRVEDEERRIAMAKSRDNKIMALSGLMPDTDKEEEKATPSRRAPPPPSSDSPKTPPRKPSRPPPEITGDIYTETPVLDSSNQDRRAYEETASVPMTQVRLAYDKAERQQTPPPISLDTAEVARESSEKRSSPDGHERTSSVRDTIDDVERKIKLEGRRVSRASPVPGKGGPGFGLLAQLGAKNRSPEASGKGVSECISPVQSDSNDILLEQLNLSDRSDSQRREKQPSPIAMGSTVDTKATALVSLIPLGGGRSPEHSQRSRSLPRSTPSLSPPSSSGRRYSSVMTHRGAQGHHSQSPGGGRAVILSHGGALRSPEPTGPRKTSQDLHGALSPTPEQKVVLSAGGTPKTTQPKTMHFVDLSGEEAFSSRANLRSFKPAKEE